MNCECCGKIVESRDNFALHTACMRNHHLHLMGERSSRCKSGVKRTTVEYQRLPADFEGDFEALMDPERYVAEATAVRALGIRRAGVFGATCPKCLMESPQADYAQRVYMDNPWICNCEAQAIVTGNEALTALGLSHLRVESGRGHVAV